MNPLDQLMATPAISHPPTATPVIDKSRPLFVTMLCGFYFVFWAANIVSLVAALLMRIGTQFPAWTDVINQASLIFIGAQVNISWVTWIIAVGLVAGIVGFWMFKKWAVIVYAAASLSLFIIIMPSTSSAPSKPLYVALILYTLATVFAINIALIVLGIMHFKRMK